MLDAVQKNDPRAGSAAAGDFTWCERRDSNSHGLPHWHLKPARLPIPPLSPGQLSNPTFNAALYKRVPGLPSVLRRNGWTIGASAVTGIGLQTARRGTRTRNRDNAGIQAIAGNRRHFMQPKGPGSSARTLGKAFTGFSAPWARPSRGSRPPCASHHDATRSAQWFHRLCA